MAEKKLKTTRRKRRSIKGLPNNPRKMEKKTGLDELERYMKKGGDVSGIVWNKKTNHIVGGNMRNRVIDVNQWPITWTEKHFGKPDHQGTIGWGFVEWELEVGKISKFAFRAVWWEEDFEKEMALVANKVGGVWDNELLKNHFSKTILARVGFDFSKIERVAMRNKHVEGEEEFSEFIGEQMQYVVLVWDNKVDWLNALSVLGLDRVKGKYRSGKTHQVGLGRIINGADIIKRLKE